MNSDKNAELDECLMLLGQALQRAGAILAARHRPSGTDSSACAVPGIAESQELCGSSSDQCVRACTAQSGLQTSANSSGRTLANERLTHRQLAAIRFLATRAGVNPDELTALVRLVGAQAGSVDQLTRAEASALLDRLDEHDGHRH